MVEPMRIPIQIADQNPLNSVYNRTRMLAGDIDGDGKQVCHSTLTFYVQQPSLLSPTSPARGH